MAELAKYEVKVAKVRPYRVITTPKPDIVGAASDENGETVFLVKRSNSSETECVTKTLAYKEFPLTVLRFYDENLNLVEDNEA